MPDKKRILVKVRQKKSWRRPASDLAIKVTGGPREKSSELFR